MATNFQYQVLADVPQFELIPEFESVYPNIIETVEELSFDIHTDELELTVSVIVDFFESIYDDSFIVEQLVDECYSDYPDFDIVVSTMPDFFEVYHDDIIERVKAWEVEEFHNENPELWELLPAAIEEIKRLHFNFGKPYFQGKIAVPGQYYFNGVPSGGSTALVANKIYYIPVYIPYTMHIVELGCWIGVQDNDGLAYLGIYNTERGFIKNLIYQNRIALNTTGYRAVGADVWLTEGFYCLAILSNSSICAIRTANIYDHMIAADHPDTLNWNTYWYETGSYASKLPAVAGVVIASGDNKGGVFRLFMKIGP